MTWTKRKSARHAELTLLTTPLPLAAIGLLERRAELGKLDKSEENDAAMVAINQQLPPMADVRYSVMRAPAMRDAYLAELTGLRYEMACYGASQANMTTLKDPAFLAACERANIPVTRRQASKYRRHRGAAWKGAK